LGRLKEAKKAILLAWHAKALVNAASSSLAYSLAGVSKKQQVLRTELRKGLERQKGTAELRRPLGSKRARKAEP
jgi:hypothetical protein